MQPGNFQPRQLEPAGGGGHTDPVELLRVSLASSPSPPAHVDLLALLRGAEHDISEIEPAADEDLAVRVRTTWTGLTDVVNRLAAAVSQHDPSPVFVVEGRYGAPVRIDAEVVRDPFRLLMVVTTLTPPVGLG